MRRLVRGLLRLLLLFAFLAAGLLVWLIHTPARHVPELPAVDERIALAQGWGEAFESEARQAFYYTPIGTSLEGLRYDWLVHLEMPWGRRRFADPEHLRSYGFAVDPQPTALNPARLPVGFARRFDPVIGEAVVDLTCAACHTGELLVRRGGRRAALRIDGAPAAHAFASARRGHLLPTLTAALASTYLNPLKFRRFGRKVLGERGYARGKWRLHADLGDVLAALARRSWRERGSRLHPIEEGFGRSDALARLASAVWRDGLAARATADSSPAAQPVAPSQGGAAVRYRPLWNAWKRAAPQSAAGVRQPMAHGMLEALRGGARVSLFDRYQRPVPLSERYRSSLDLLNVHRVESLLQKLRPPRWPEQHLGEIDRNRAEWGRRLFERHCERCHGARELPDPLKRADAPLRTVNDPLWRTATSPLAEVGTDPSAALASASRTVDLRPTGLTPADVRSAFFPALDERQRRLRLLEEELAALVEEGKPSATQVEAGLRRRVARLQDLTRRLDALDMARVPIGTALDVILTLARRHRYRESGLSLEQQECLDGFSALALPSTSSDYEARPLAGVWASAPYLHNGSVPTLYQLLSPQDERDERFFLSPGAFDPKAVGVDTEVEGDGFWFDTRLEGNSNVGHEFRAGYAGPDGGPQHGVIGPALSVEERFALVEYLKVHEDPETLPGRLAPDCGLR